MPEEWQAAAATEVTAEWVVGRWAEVWVVG